LGAVKVTGSGGNGGNQYIIAPLTTNLNNPSQISLDTINVALPVVYQGVVIGRAAISVSSQMNDDVLCLLIYAVELRSGSGHKRHSY
jgi:hypothetical protein